MSKASEIEGINPMLKRIVLALALVPTVAMAAPWPGTCRDFGGVCIERPGLLANGAAVVSYHVAPARSIGGTVPLFDGIKGSPIFVIAVSNGAVTFKARGIVYGAEAKNIFVQCSTGRIWLGGVINDPVCPP